MSTKQMAMPGIHDQIIAIMDKQPRGTVLDAPAGSGALSKRLSDMGFEVSCCDIDSGNFHHHDQFSLSLADFNRDELPYPNKQFDYVICSNGLHRLYYPANVLKEFERVTKDNGQMILSWPNYNSISRRLKFLLTGSIGASIDRAHYDQTITEPAAKVRFPLSTTRMEFLLKSRGVTIGKLKSVGFRLYEIILLPISLVIAILNAVSGRRCSDNKLAVIAGGSTTIAICKKN